MAKIKKTAKKTPKATKTAPPATEKKTSVLNINDAPPADDTYLKTLPVNFLPRAGFTSYELELKERLQDVEEEKNEVFYILPIRMDKDTYRSLLRQTIETSQTTKNKDWTEKDEVLHQLKFLCN